MRNTYLSSTELKRKTAKILNMVAYGKIVAVIERYGEPIAKIIPVVPFGKDEDLEKKIKNHFGAIPDLPDVSRARYFRKRKINL